MSKSGATFPFDRTCAPCEAWRLAWSASEMWWSCAYRVADRASWLGGPLPGADPATRSARHAWERLWSEKLALGMEVGLEMQRASYELMLGRFDPWRSGTRMLARTRSASRQAGARPLNPAK